MCLSVLLHRLAEAVGASRGEGRGSVGRAVPAALCESLVGLGGCAWHVVALRAPMSARGVIGLLQIAHRALGLRLVSAVESMSMSSSLEAKPKNLMRVVLNRFMDMDSLGAARANEEKNPHPLASSRQLYQFSDPLCLCSAAVHGSVGGMDTRKQVSGRPTIEGWASDIEQCLCATFVFTHKGVVIFFISLTMVIVCFAMSAPWECLCSC